MPSKNFLAKSETRPSASPVTFSSEEKSEKFKCPPLQTSLTAKGRVQNDARMPRMAASSLTQDRNVKAASAASTPNLGAYVISSCPAPYSQFIVLTSTPTCSKCSSSAYVKSCTFWCCKVEKMSTPSKAGTHSFPPWSRLASVNSYSNATKSSNPKSAFNLSSCCRQIVRGTAPHCGISQRTRTVGAGTQGSASAVSHCGSTAQFGQPAAEISSGNVSTMEFAPAASMPP
mmetsp:Transcript_14875/g.45041  ORF Transcript_14875/g.45041 Transcript_14875/m.45041 type:complete len:230 (+) Transcript_14875:776-1465(+)